MADRSGLILATRPRRLTRVGVLVMAGHLGRDVPDGLAGPITPPYCELSGVSMHAVLKASAASLQGAPANDEGAVDAEVFCIYLEKNEDAINPYVC